MNRSSDEIRTELREAYRALGYLIGVAAVGVMWVAVWVVWTA